MHTTNHTHSHFTKNKDLAALHFVIPRLQVQTGTDTGTKAKLLRKDLCCLVLCYLGAEDFLNARV